MRAGTSTSLWEATARRATVPSVELPRDVDVLIVGAGYTGLWTARSLLVADPARRVAVIDREHVGFGASGRNGGWCSALLPVSIGALAARHGRDAAVAMYRAMFGAVADVEAFAEEGGEAGDEALCHRGGTLTMARTPRQLARLTDEVAELAAFGIGADDVRLVGAAEASAVCAATGVRGGLFSPHCAAIHPLDLARALADDARRRGAHLVDNCIFMHDPVQICNRSARRTGPRPPIEVATSRGVVRTEVLVLATEAFTAAIPGRRRDVLPVYSLMIGSEPLTDDQWGAVGLADRTTFADARRTVIYGQRTADGRLAFGGRGAPYHFGSRIEPAYDRNEQVRAQLARTVAELFPALSGVRFPHHWGGPLGVPRDWHPHVRFDRSSGLAVAGGYVGDGVATANLAGRTLADLLLGRDTDLTRLPWVGHRSRRWEPEPLRWLGVRAAAATARRADDADFAGRRTAGLWDRAFDRLT